PHGRKPSAAGPDCCGADVATLSICEKICVQIGSPQSRRPRQQAVTGGTFDDPNWFKFGKHIWTQSKLHWVEIPPDVSNVGPRRLLRAGAPVFDGYVSVRPPRARYFSRYLHCRFVIGVVARSMAVLQGRFLKTETAALFHSRPHWAGRRKESQRMNANATAAPISSPIPP